MRATMFVVLAFVAATVAAQTPRKNACELLSTADVEAVLGIAPLRAFDPLNKGEYCRFERLPGQAAFSVEARYTDVADADAVLKWLKAVETKTYNKARPAAGLGDAAYYSEPFGNPAVPKTLTVFVAGRMFLQIGPSTSDQQLRTLAEKALGQAGPTGFAYNGAVPPTVRPASPSPRNAASSSPLDQLKSALTTKADAGESSAEEALADLYRFADTTANPDYATAMYWYKRASDHGVARASFELGTMYHEGIGAQVNDVAAKELFTKAADAGYVPAMMPLALIYAASPDFVSKRRAGEWALKAAAGNDPEGHLTAGYLWDKGLLSFDEAESGRNALAEYRRAADQGNCIAAMNIGGLYFKGSHGLKQDAVQAEQWFDRAQACFGKAVADMHQTAARYRSLAAAGRLPVPEAPPTPSATSHYFHRPGSGGQELTPLAKLAAGVIAVTAVVAAYYAAHPELLKDLPADAGAGRASGSKSWADEQSDSMQRWRDSMHSAEITRKAWAGQCKPPVGCV
jgi:TPR repeat protein